MVWVIFWCFIWSNRFLSPQLDLILLAPLSRTSRQVVYLRYSWYSLLYFSPSTSSKSSGSYGLSRLLHFQFRFGISKHCMGFFVGPFHSFSPLGIVGAFAPPPRNPFITPDAYFLEKSCKTLLSPPAVSSSTLTILFSVSTALTSFLVSDSADYSFLSIPIHSSHHLSLYS